MIVSPAALLRVALGGVALLGLHVAERRWPLRRALHPGPRRLLVNLAVGVVALGAVALIYGTVVIGAVSWAERHEVGVIRWLGVPDVVAWVLAIVLLDYTLWHWHWLNHRVGFLWRFHAAHHADLDLDASTALRFHPGELLASVPFRAAQVSVLGVAAAPLVAWETLVLVFTLFHHSNLRLPARLERALGLVLITPRVHGIHHSRRPGELHANFGTLSSAWDRLHRLRVTDVAQESIVIGLPGQSEHELGLGRTLAVPFRAAPPPR